MLLISSYIDSIVTRKSSAIVLKTKLIKENNTFIEQNKIIQQYFYRFYIM